MNRFAIALLCALPLTACIDEEGDTDLDEETSATVSALCTDGGADATVAFDDKGGFITATSAALSSSYDRAACSNRFSVEVTRTSAATQQFSVVGGWGEPLPSYSTGCAAAWAKVQTQQYTQTLNCANNLCFPVWGWHNVGSEVTLHGVWTTGDFGGCELVPTTPLPTLQPSQLRPKVRVSVSAYATSQFGTVYKKAKGGVYSQPIIW